MQNTIVNMKKRSLHLVGLIPDGTIAITAAEYEAMLRRQYEGMDPNEYFALAPHDPEAAEFWSALEAKLCSKLDGEGQMMHGMLCIHARQVGMHAGLLKGWRYRELEYKQRDEARRCLLDYYREFPGSSEQETCIYLDEQIDRIITLKRLYSKRFDSRELPLPPKRWGIDWRSVDEHGKPALWRTAFREKRGTLSSYLSRQYALAWGPRSAFSIARRRLASAANETKKGKSA
jgi:hypothetical protein